MMRRRACALAGMLALLFLAAAATAEESAAEKPAAPARAAPAGDVARESRRFEATGAAGAAAARRAELAEAEARLAADRLRRLEAELGLREYDLTALVDAGRREAERTALDAGEVEEAYVLSSVDTASAKIAGARGVLSVARREAAAAAEARKKEALRRQELRLALLHLEARAPGEDPRLVEEDRRLLNALGEVSRNEERALEGIGGAWEKRREIAVGEVAAWRDHRVALHQGLAALRFRNLLSPTGAGRGRRVFAALGLAAVLLLLYRLRPVFPALLRRPFPEAGEGWRREAADALVLILGAVVFVSALAAALARTDLALFVLGRGLAALLGLSGIGTAYVWAERRLRARNAQNGILAWTARGALVLLGAVVLICALDLPWRPTLRAARTASRILVVTAVRIGVLVGALALFLLLLRRLGAKVIRIAGRPGGRETYHERAQRVETLVGVFHGVATLTVGVLGVFVVLREIGLDVTPFLAGAGIAGVAIGFGAQSLIRDFLTGFFIIMENQYTVGDVIRAGDLSGMVERVGLRTTVLRDLAGTVHVIPNGEITKVSNLTHEWSRAVVEVGVAYGEDVDHVRYVMHEAGRAMRAEAAWREVMLEEPEILGIEAFGDSALAFKMIAKTAPLKQWDVARELRRRIKRAFDAEGIEIPFPQQIVYRREEPPRPEGAKRRRRPPPDGAPGGRPGAPGGGGTE